MSQIVVVYHSGYGHTQRVAQQVADGANAQLLAIDADGNLPEGGWETLNAADAIIFGTPTYMGGPSWQFKKFADASSKAWFSRAWQDKVFGGFTKQRQLQWRQTGHADCAANPGVAARWRVGKPGHVAQQQQDRHAQRCEQPGWLGGLAGAVAI